MTINITGYFDNYGSETGHFDPGTETDDATPLLQGTSTVPLGTTDLVLILRDGVFLGMATVAANGTEWSFQESGLTEQRAYTYQALVLSFGNPANPGVGVSNSCEITLTVPPPPPPANVTALIAWDDKLPETGAIANDGKTNDDTPTLQGVLSRALITGESVHIFRNGREIATADTAVGDTTFSYTDSGLVNSTAYTYTAKVMNAAGVSGNEGSVHFTYEATVIPPTTLEAWDDKLPDTGRIPNNGESNDDTPTLKGVTERALIDGESVHILRNGRDIGTATLDTNKTDWSYTDNTGGLVDGTIYTYTAKVMNDAGESGHEASVRFTFVDPVPNTTLTAWDDKLPVTGQIANDSTTNDDTPTLKGTVVERALRDDESVHIFRNDVDLGTASVAANGKDWEYADSGLVYGTAYTYMAKVVNGSGNSGAEATVNFNFAALPPATSLEVWDYAQPATGKVNEGETINDETPTLKGALRDALTSSQSVHIFRNDHDIGTASVDASGMSWEYKDNSGLTSGTTYTYMAKVIDSATGFSVDSEPVSLTFTVDTTPTQTSTLTVWDNQSPVIGWVVDGNTTNDDTPTLQGVLSAPLTPSQSLEIIRNGEILEKIKVTGTEWSYSDYELTSGETYRYTVKVVNDVNQSGAESAPLSLTFVYNPSPAGIQITGITNNEGANFSPIYNNSHTNDNTPLITIKIPPLETGESVVLVRDGGTPNATTIPLTIPPNVTSYNYQESALSEGKHTYVARVVNAGSPDTVDSDMWTFTVDTIAPDAKATITSIQDDTGISATDFITNDQTLLVNATVDKALAANEKVQISLDNGAHWNDARSMGSGVYQYDARATELTAGDHTFKARVVDLAGNVGQETSQVVTIDITPPPPITITITAIEDDTGIPGDFITTDQTLLFHGGLSRALTADERVQVSLDGKDWHIATVTTNAAGETTWVWDNTANTLPGGDYLIRARVVDVAGNNDFRDNVQHSLSIETVTPIKTPHIDAIWDNVAPVTGIVESGKETDDSTPELRGTVSAPLARNEIVAIYRNDGTTDVLVGTTKVSSGSTNWSFTDNSGGMVENQTYKYTAYVETLGGLQGSKSNDYSMIYETIPTVRLRITEVYDDKEPVTGPVANDGSTNDDTPRISGTVNGDMRDDWAVAVYRNDGTTDVRAGTATMTGSRTWSFDDSGLADGKTYTYTAYVENASGNKGAVSENTWVIHTDFTPIDDHQEVRITDLIDDFGPVTGSVVSGKATDDQTPELKGTVKLLLADNEFVVISRDNVEVGKTKPSAGSLNWSFTDPTRGMVEGTLYTYTAKVVDAAGHESRVSNEYSMIFAGEGGPPPTTPAQVSGVYDDQEPVTGLVPNDGYTNDTSPEIRGTIPADLNRTTGEAVVVYRDDGTGKVKVGVATVTGHDWTFTDNSGVPEDGKTYTYTAQVENVRAQVGPLTDGWTIHVDTTAPDMPSIDQVIDNRLHTMPLASGPIVNGGVTDDLTPTFKGSDAEPNSVIRLYDGANLVGSTTADASGNWTFTLRLGNQDNSSVPDTIIFQEKTYTITSVDRAGNESVHSEEFKFTVDNEAPRLAVTITDVMDDVGPVQGKVPNTSSRAYTGTTDDPTPLIKGMVYLETSPGVKTPTPVRADHGDKVYIFMSGNDGSSMVEAATVDSSGYWTYQAHNLASGVTYNYYARVVNSAGVGSGQSNPLTLTVDASAILTQPILVGDNVRYYGTSDADVIATSATALGKSAWVHGVGTDGLSHDMVMGGGSNDLIGIIGTNFTSISGGIGADTLAFESSNLTLNLTTLGYRVSGFERFDLNNQVNNANAAVSDPTGQATALTHGNTLKLTLADVINQADNPYLPQKLTILGDAQSTVDLTDAGWSKVGDQAGFDVWHNAAQGTSTVADLLIQQAVHVTHL